MAKDNSRSVIVTFKPKDQRPDKDKDKLEIVESVVKEKKKYVNAEDMSRGQAVPSGMPESLMAYDVNHYEAPLVMATLTKAEIDALKKNDNVEAVEDDGLCYALGGLVESLEVEGQPSALAETIPAGVAQVRAPAAWDCSRGKAIKVFVLDTGIDKNHPDLKPNYKGGISFVAGESSPMDFNSHGTHCAGTIAASINGSGLVGVAPTAYLYAVKVLSKTGSGQWSWLIAGIDWCTKKKGRKILSMSMGGSAPNAVGAMCKTAYNKGCLLVAASGNGGTPGGVIDPAKYESVVAVSAIDNSNAIAGFSDTGPEIELCAPGVNVLSTIPGGGFGKKSGTSMACPHVSGAAALAWGGHRYSDNVTIRSVLARNADGLGSPGRDPVFGFGRVDAENSACSVFEPGVVPGIPSVPIP